MRALLGRNVYEFIWTFQSSHETSLERWIFPLASIYFVVSLFGWFSCWVCVRVRGGGRGQLNKAFYDKYRNIPQFRYLRQREIGFHFNNLISAHIKFIYYYTPSLKYYFVFVQLWNSLYKISRFILQN